MRNCRTGTLQTSSTRPSQRIQGRKAVNNIILDFAGEEDPRRICSYGMAEKRMQALRDVADPSPPLYLRLVCDDRLQYSPGTNPRRSDPRWGCPPLSGQRPPDRRLGITKDAIATVVFGSGVTNPKVSGVHDQIQSEKKSHYRHSL